MSQRAHRPTAGVTFPLSALSSRRGTGIGEIPDLLGLAATLAEAEVDITVFQLLPLTPMSEGCDSPYSSCSSFGVDPIYLDLKGAARELSQISRMRIPEPVVVAPAGERVDFAGVRRLKQAAAEQVYNAVADKLHLHQNLATFCDAHTWARELALFLTLTELHGPAWWHWPSALARREADALAHASQQHAHRVRFHQMLQWLAHRQWSTTREHLRNTGIEVMGDLPFMVAAHSVDTWLYPDCFDRERSLGVPGDVLNPEGQDWSLPAHRWQAIEASGDAWVIARTYHHAQMFDRLRIDHAVGYFRTYSRRCSDLVAKPLVPGTFEPDSAPDQRAMGRRTFTAMLAAARKSDCTLIAEDLGQIPEFVPEVLGELGVPGYRVIPWEFEGDTLACPTAFPRGSVACFGTHDTDTLAGYWRNCTRPQRDQIVDLAIRCGLDPTAELAELDGSPKVHSLLLRLIFAANSELALVMLQDLLASEVRLNVPGTVADTNWTYRLPGPVDALNQMYPQQLAHVRDCLGGSP